MAKQVRVWGLEQLPEIRCGDDLGLLIAEAAAKEGIELQDRDVVVVTSKVVSKAEGRIVRRETVKVGRAARRLARVTRSDPRAVQVMLDSCRGVVGVIPLGLALRYFGTAPFRGAPERIKAALEREPTLFVTLMPHGGLATDAGVDSSNVSDGYCTLPCDPNASASKLRDRLREITGKDVAVILSDTEFRVLRQGTTDVAVGTSGIQPIRAQFGEPDRFGRAKIGGMDAVADLIAGTAALVMGQTAEGVPVVIVRGVDYLSGEPDPAGLAMPAKWLALGLLYFVWSRLRLWVARHTGI